MHNCKSIRETFVELALDEVSPARSAQLLAELKDCRQCQEEFATTRSTLRMTGQALESSLPAEDFWPGYHARLQTALTNGRARQDENSIYSPHAEVSSGSRFWLALRSLLTASVRVPAPLAAALVLLFGVSVFIATQSRGAATPTHLTASPIESVAAQTRVVEVPVIQEKVVTRVVYVETNRRSRNANYSNDDEGDEGRMAVADVTNGIARVRPDPRGAAMSLAGFKPTDEVKLTIIKGSDPK